MKLGFIGAGNMATAIIKGAVKSGTFSASEIAVYDVDFEKSEKLKAEFGIKACNTTEELLGFSQTVVLAVKPNVFETLLPAVAKEIYEKKLFVISIAAGKTLDFIAGCFKYDIPVVRVMPNINATVFQAMSAYCKNNFVSDEQEECVVRLCSSFGKVISLSEDKFSVFSSIAGCGPAFSYMFIDSLARAGVKNGLTKNQALEIAAQTVLGSAEKILESDEHPWELIDKVCSPGGTTIEGVCTLQENSFEATVEKAVDASYIKDKNL